MPKKKIAAVGQQSLTKELSKIVKIFTLSECEIKPHFFLTGGSGTGKSLTIQTLAHEYNVGFIEINAAQLTKEGVSGNSLSKALSPMLQLGNKPTIVFVDEFDKLFVSGNLNNSSAHESTTGVQNEFLKVLESTTTSVFGDYGKFLSVPMNNVLFCFAGAFNGEKGITLDRLREIGLKTEFLGRVGLVYNTNSLTLEDMFDILEGSPLLSRYLDLFENVDRETVVLTIKGYVKKHFEMNTLGARMINTLIHQYFIKGGLVEEEVIKATFQRKLSLND